MTTTRTEITAARAASARHRRIATSRALAGNMLASIRAAALADMLDELAQTLDEHEQQERATQSLARARQQAQAACRAYVLD